MPQVREVWTEDLRGPRLVMPPAGWAQNLGESSFAVKRRQARRPLIRTEIGRLSFLFEHRKHPFARIPSSPAFPVGEHSPGHRHARPSPHPDPKGKVHSPRVGGIRHPDEVRHPLCLLPLTPLPRSRGACLPHLQTRLM